MFLEVRRYAWDLLESYKILKTLKGSWTFKFNFLALRTDSYNPKSFYILLHPLTATQLSMAS